jgi:hypothetical protein
VATILKEYEFNFEDEGLLVVQKVAGAEIDEQYNIRFNTDMEFTESSKAELRRLGEYLVRVSDKL